MKTSKGQRDTEAALCAEFERYVAEQGLGDRGDAEELLVRTDLTAGQRRWLSEFVLRWDAMLEQGKARSVRTELGKGSQEYIYTEVLRLGPHTCRIEIMSDTYRFQCYAIAKVWSTTELRWNDVTSVHYSQMNTADGLIHSQASVGFDDFKVDRNRLLEQLRDILEQ